MCLGSASITACGMPRVSARRGRMAPASGDSIHRDGDWKSRRARTSLRMKTQTMTHVYRMKPTVPKSSEETNDAAPASASPYGLMCSHRASSSE
eukprot:scaffold1861_cov111-Isochrysis_galbana.AAC.5